jgi:large subunit ribosomal protein L18
MYAQIIDDTQGNTLVAASSLEEAAAAGTKTEQARRVGELVADRAKAAGIERVVFDRGGFLYHGRIKAVADGARANGLEF